MRKEDNVASLSTRTLSGRVLAILLAVMTAFVLTAGLTKPAYADTVLGFSSDVHNTDSNSAANRLGTWIDSMRAKYGHVDYMAFGGDMGSASANGTAFWTYTQADMDVMVEKGVEAIYTTGNHEYMNGSYSNDANSTTKNYREDQEVLNTDTFHMYALGSSGSNWNQYSGTQISTLKTYLASITDNKPIIIITHYPLHWTSSRSITGAGDLIKVLNDAADSGKKIVFLWGHNHTDAAGVETHYDEIFAPTESIQYSSNQSAELSFYYAAAGCMSDSDYGAGSGAVKGKGLILTINDQNKLSFAYYDANGNNVTEDGSGGAGTEYTEKDPVAVTGVTVSPEETTVMARKSVQLTATVLPEEATKKGVTWTSSNEGIAVVNTKGKVRGVSEGEATITATTVDGGFTASAKVTVTPNTSTVSEYVIMVGDHALTTERSSNTATSGSSSWGGSGYTYTGLEALTLSSSAEADDTARWIFEESEDGTGYYIMSQDGLYLNATYTTTSSSSWSSGGKGDLKLDDTPDVWVLDDGFSLDDGVIEGSYLKSTNASNGNSSAKYLAYEDSGDLFSVRSESNADKVTIEEAGDPVAATGVTVSPATATVEANRTVQLTATVAPSNATNKKVTWTSADTSIATVDANGKVRGVAEGATTITATTADGGFTSSATVTVIPNSGTAAEYEVSITPTTDKPEESISIAVGDKLTVNVKNGSSNSAYNFTATLSKNGIADITSASTVNIAAGDTAQFTFEGLADGTVDITIQNDQSSSSYVRKGVIHLTVGEGGGSEEPPTGDKVSITPTTDNPEESIKIAVGDTLTIDVKNGSSNSAYDFTATLSNSGIAEISGASTVNIAAGGNGQFTVTGLSAGTVDITIQNQNSYGSQYTRKGIIHLTVEQAGDPVAVTGVTVSPTTASVVAGKTTQLTATVAPSNATNKKVSWKSSDTSIATVDSNGKVTGVKAGTATITVTTDDGSKTATATITVTEPDPTATVTYQLVDTVEAGQDYLIATGNSGSVYLLSGEAGSSSDTLKGYSATVSDSKITIDTDTEAKTAYTAEAGKDADSFRLVLGGKYLYANNSGALRLESGDIWSQQSGGGSSNSGKYWHYKGADKYLLWFFLDSEDSSGSNGYNYAGQTYRYYIDYDNNGNFSKGTVTSSSTSIADTSTPKIYLYAKTETPGPTVVPVESVTLSDETLSLNVGDTATLTATIAPENATNKDLTWTSSDESVVTVDENGNITAVAAGEAVIMVYSTDGPGNWCVVTVTDPSATKYTVTFLNYDGTELLTAEYPEGTKASAISQPDKVPTKPSDDEYDYKFAGWDPPLADVTADATYTATFTAVAKVKWVRLAGEGRYDTMQEIAQAGFESSEYAVLVTGKNFPDALSASALAGKYNCPVILTAPNALSKQAKEELERLGVRKVFIVGGEGSVSAAVFTEVSKNYAVERISGEGRQDTSIEVAKAVTGGNLDTIVVCSGAKVYDKKGNEKGFADALSIGPWCYSTATPIVLTGFNKKISDEKAAELKALGVKKVIVVGGTGSVDADDVAAKLGLDKDNTDQFLVLAGQDRYETSALVAYYEILSGMEMTNVSVATGKSFPDALAGAALCGTNNSVLILADSKNDVGLQLISNNVGIETGYVLGGENTVSADLMSYLESLTK